MFRRTFLGLIGAAAALPAMRRTASVCRVSRTGVVFRGPEGERELACSLSPFTIRAGSVTHVGDAPFGIAEHDIEPGKLGMVVVRGPVFVRNIA